jgi:hypothetical protein
MTERRGEMDIKIVPHSVVNKMHPSIVINI